MCTLLVVFAQLLATDSLEGWTLDFLQIFLSDKKVDHMSIFAPADVHVGSLQRVSSYSDVFLLVLDKEGCNAVEAGCDFHGVFGDPGERVWLHIAVFCQSDDAVDVVVVLEGL